MNVSEGQTVWLQSGDEVIEATVLKVTEKFIKVEVDPNGLGTFRVFDRVGNYRTYQGGHGVRCFPVFDKNGKQPEGNDPDFDIEVWFADAGAAERPLCGKGGEPWRLRATEPTRVCLRLTPRS